MGSIIRIGRYPRKQAEEPLYEFDNIPTALPFSGSLAEALPDETTILNFRH